MRSEEAGGSMRICVVSETGELAAQLNEPEYTVLHRVPGAEAPTADVYVWDVWPDERLREAIGRHPGAQHFLLIDSRDLAACGELQNSVCVLLKPFAAFRMRAFIELAWKTFLLHQRVQETDHLRSDRDALLQYVLEVNLKLQEYDQERNNFLARALHDFRAPLTTLHGYCELLADGIAGAVTAAQRTLLERMQASTRRLTKLAGGALELLAEGRFEMALRREPGDLTEAVRQAIHEIYPLAKEKDIELKIDLRATDPLLFQADQLQQVLVNLLENACKFTPVGGWIEVRCYESSHETIQNGNGRRYQVDINDSGPGVPAALAEKIFEQYTSYSGGADRSVGGLGLAIARAIVRAHGGSIWATPGSEGGRFSFVLPFEAGEKAGGGGEHAGSI